MSALPSGFEALEPFVAIWAIDGTAARDAMRGASSDPERQAFYAAAMPLLPAALDHLDAVPLANHDNGQRRLMNLCLAFAHVAQAVEMQADDEEKHRPSRETMVITRSPADG